MRRARLSGSQVGALSWYVEEGEGLPKTVPVQWPDTFEPERRPFAATGPPVVGEPVELAYTVGTGEGKIEERTIVGKVKRIVIEIEPEWPRDGVEQA